MVEAERNGTAAYWLTRRRTWICREASQYLPQPYSNSCTTAPPPVTRAGRRQWGMISERQPSNARRAPGRAPPVGVVGARQSCAVDRLVTSYGRAALLGITEWHRRIGSAGDATVVHQALTRPQQPSQRRIDAGSAFCLSGLLRSQLRSPRFFLVRSTAPLGHGCARSGSSRASRSLTRRQRRPRPNQACRAAPTDDLARARAAPAPGRSCHGGRPPRGSGALRQPGRACC